MADGRGWELDPDKLLATIDDPAHFRKSSSVGAYAGLTVCHSASSSGFERTVCRRRLRAQAGWKLAAPSKYPPAKPRQSRGL